MKQTGSRFNFSCPLNKQKMLFPPTNWKWLLYHVVTVVVTRTNIIPQDKHSAKSVDLNPIEKYTFQIGYFLQKHCLTHRK